MKQYNDGEGTIWFHSDAGESMGYWEHIEGDVYVMRGGSAYMVNNFTDIKDVRNCINMSHIAVARPKKADNTVALIGFMAAKLACYEPDSHTVKQALEWLDARTQTR